MQYSYWPNCIRVLCALLLLLGMSGAGRAVLPPWGAQIVNQAHVTFIDAATHLNGVLDSNTVRAIVQAQPGVTLVHDTTVVLPPGAPVQLYHILTNTGNAPGAFLLTAQNLAGDDFDVSTLQVIVDRDGNGLVDKDDLPVPAGDTITLEPGETVSLIVSGFTASDLAPQTQARVRLTAAVANLTATVTDTVRLVNTVAVQVQLAASTLTVHPKDTITYTVIANNLGNVDAQALPVTIDGAGTSRVILALPIPVNTHYVDAAIIGTGELLYHYAVDPPYTFRTTPPAPANAGAVDQVAYATRDFPHLSTQKLTVTVAADLLASGTIPNTASLHLTDPVLAGPVHTPSNTVLITVPRQAPVLHYYTDDTFADVAGSTHLGSPLHVQVQAAEKNRDPEVAETIRVKITSVLTGDIEVFIATETGPNTGVFRIGPNPLTQDAIIQGSTPGDGILQTLSNDMLVAAIEGYDGLEIKTDVLVDPYGTVFDSMTGLPVAGAIVRLIDVTGQGNGGHPGGLADVFDDNGNPAPNVITTGPDGRYRFPLVRPSTYRLELVMPNGFTFPSQLPPALLSPGFSIDPVASYGGTFDVLATSEPINIDLPADFQPSGGLFVQKTAGRKQAELGDSVAYTLVVKNNTGTPLTGATLIDDLPHGVWFLADSAKLDGAPILPAGGRGPRLTFSLPALAVGQSMTVTYRAHLGPATAIGPVTNQAQASAMLLFGLITSNRATATVQVSRGLFTDKGVIVGKVFFDVDRNGVQGTEEVGVPGVRIYLDDGTFAVTDSEGKYNLYGVSPRMHVLKVDKSTLPTGACLRPLSNRHGGVGGSSFVDMVRGEVHKVNFAIRGAECPVNASIMTQIVARRSAGEVSHAETATRLRTELTVDAASRLPADRRALAASGTAEGVNPARPAVVTPAPTATTSTPPQRLLSTMAPDEVQALVNSLNNTVGFINLHDGQLLPEAQTAVQVKGVPGTHLLLKLNGTDVPESAIGARSTAATIQLLEYIGITLVAGENILEVVQRDGFGINRGSQRILVRAPGSLAHFRVTVPPTAQPADGQTPVMMRVALLDAQGNPVAMRTPVTLQASMGEWQTPDLDTQTEGLQLFVEGGVAEVVLVSPKMPGLCMLTVSSGLLQHIATIDFMPNLRPLIVVGGVEGSVHLRKLKTGAVLPNGRDDGFDAAMPLYSTPGSHSGGTGHIGLYLKGAIPGDRLLTVAYDSQKDEKTRLFRDIQPDEFFPVYGDSSLKGYDAQSTSPLYVLVEQQLSYLLYGDFTTYANLRAMSLGNYSRSFTGLRHHLETGKGQLNTFASFNAQRQQVEEMPANGTSGPYYLRGTLLVENSEKVEIVVRDRNQPSVVLKTTPQQRFTDYEVEPFTGRLLFRAPVPSLTPELNPITIRVSYEVEQGGTKYWVAGVDGQVNLNRRVTVGGSLVTDRNPQDKASLASVNVTYAMTPASTLLGEVARTTRASLGDGWGQRLKWNYRGQRGLFEAFAGKTDIAFDNPTSVLGKGRLETGANGEWTLDATSRLRGTVLRTQDVATDGVRTGASASIERTFRNGLSLETGIRHGHETATPAQGTSISATPNDFTSVRVKVRTPLPRRPQINLFGEYERDLNDSRRRIAAVGGDYQLTTVSRLYARHEFVSSLSGPYALNDTQTHYTSLLGVESQYSRDGRLFSEYRARDAFSGREAEAAIGLRNAWEVRPGVRVNASYEQLRALSGTAVNSDSTAVTGAVEYTPNPLWKGTARIELRQATNENTVLNTLGAAVKVHRDWTLLAKNLLSLTNTKVAGQLDSTTEHLQFGMAYRPVDDDVWNGFVRYEYQLRKHPIDAVDDNVGIHIFRTAVNYQPQRAWVYTTQYAAKLVRDRDRSGVYALTHLIAGRATYDFSERWDFGLMASLLADTKAKDRRTGLGAEVGFLLTSNLYLGMGYNVFGFHDDYLAGEDYTDQGAFFRLRFKFDEDLFGGNNPRVNKMLPPAGSTAGQAAR